MEEHVQRPGSSLGVSGPRCCGAANRMMEVGSARQRAERQGLPSVQPRLEASGGISTVFPPLRLASPPVPRVGAGPRAWRAPRLLTHTAQSVGSTPFSVDGGKSGCGHPGGLCRSLRARLVVSGPQEAAVLWRDTHTHTDRPPVSQIPTSLILTHRPTSI